MSQIWPKGHGLQTSATGLTTTSDELGDANIFLGEIFYLVSTLSFNLLSTL